VIAKELTSVWRLNGQKGDYVFLATKQNGSWRDHSFEIDSDLPSRIEAFLKQHPPQQYDLYWSPLVFRAPRRRTENVKPTRLLWSDMDAVDIEQIDKQGLLPTHYWESSPGRYQGLWELDQLLEPPDAEALNKSLSYRIGADKGGWDLTQVLRIPGTINHKYPEKPTVGRIIRSDEHYHYHSLREAEWFTGNGPSPDEDIVPNVHEASREEVLAILSRYHGKIPRKVLTLLFATTATHGKRSDILWYIEHELHDAGVPPSEILALVKGSVWNKYRGRKDENERLRREIKKILENTLQEPTTAEKEGPTPSYGFSFKIEDYGEVLGKIGSQPGWLVEGFWTRRSHGIVAGEPKSMKSILTLDLAISIASGKPFLNQFDVKEKGPVLIVQNENADWIMRDRMEKMMVDKGLAGEVKVQGSRLHVTWPKRIPLYFINQQGYQLNEPMHRALLEEAIRQIRPVLIIFDPLYLMFDGDVNSAKDLNPVLNWLLYLKTEYKAGVVVVHHWNKGSTPKRGGQRMLGSTTLHGWVESAWYIEVTSRNPDGEESAEVNPGETPPISLVLEREFRSAGIHPKVELNVSMGGFQESTYSVSVKQHAKKKKQVEETGDEQDLIVELLTLNKKPLSSRTISEHTGISRRKVATALTQLASRGEIVKSSGGYKLKGLRA